MTAVARPKSVRSRNLSLMRRLLLVTVGMFGFGYALVPLYGWICDITGFNGTTGRVEAASLAPVADRNRTVTVQFLATVNGQLPWEFKAPVASLEVTPGKLYETAFEVRNRAEHAVTGKATPSVAPIAAAAHFNKTECFCFTEQRLEAGSTVLMPVRFVVNERLPAKVEMLTLSYTFFAVPNAPPSVTSAPTAG